MSDGYSIAAGSIDITPQTPIPLAGYAALRKPAFERVADPLEANVAILRNGDQMVAFVALDLMYVGAFLRDAIVNALAGQIPREAIFTSACHTHSGPPTEDSLPVLGAVTAAYRNLVAQRVSELAVRLLAGAFVPVSLEYLEGNAAHSINRRKRVFGISRNFPFLGPHVSIRPNPSGPRDDTIHMIRIRDGGGKDVAVCWCYACHPVGYPLLDVLSAEYPGVVRNTLRRALGDIPVVFWQGFSGNTAPLGTVRPMVFRARTLRDWEEWANGLAQCVQDTAGGASLSLPGPIACTMRALPLPELGLLSDKQVRLHEIRLGPQLIICGLSAEVAVEYVGILGRLHAPVHVIPVGCVGDVYGYLPVDAMVREGGYEARGFVPRFGLRGSFVANVEEIVTERLFCAATPAHLKTQGRAANQSGANIVERSGDRPAPTGTVDV
jgi:neutral ceramidase